MPGLPKVLIVEDDPALSMALREKLDVSGYETLVVNNGEKGLNVVLNAMPDCVILDLIMPQMGGIEMLKKLRLISGCEVTPVIVLTNIGNVEEISEVAHDDYVWAFTKSDTSLADILVAIRGVIKK